MHIYKTEPVIDKQILNNQGRDNLLYNNTDNSAVIFLNWCIIYARTTHIEMMPFQEKSKIQLCWEKLGLF